MQFPYSKDDKHNLYFRSLTFNLAMSTVNHIKENFFNRDKSYFIQPTKKPPRGRLFLLVR